MKLEKIIKLNEKHNLIEENDKIIVGFSGGPDSVFLVEVLKKLRERIKFDIFLVHINHLLRAENSDGDELFKWTLQRPKPVIDPQSAYMLSSILSDAHARRKVFGSMGYSFGFVIPNVWTATKTGTTENGRGSAKDFWMMSYSPVIASGAWVGNHDGKPTRHSGTPIVRRVIHNYMRDVHLNVYAKQGKWKKGDKINQPAGMKVSSFMGRRDIWPSWFDVSNFKKEEIVFDKISKKLATECTPELAKESISVYKMKDPISNKDIFTLPEGYTDKEEDDVHSCSEARPIITNLNSNLISGNLYNIAFSVKKGNSPLKSIELKVNGNTIYSSDNVFNNSVEFSFDQSNADITLSVVDEKYYQSVCLFAKKVCCYSLYL